MELYHEFSVYGGYTTTLYLKRNMAGGEKKRVSPIDSEIERERLRRMEERMHGPVEQEQVVVDEEVVEPALAAETTMNNIGAASRTGERNARVSFAGGYERGEVHFYYDREQFD